MTHHLDLSEVVLQKGAHEARDEGLCMMEAVAWWADEPHSDHPECTSPVIAAFLRRWNDDLDDEGRQRLKPYIPKLVGTITGPEDDERRAWMLTDWLVRIYLPAWLRLAKLEDQAHAVEQLDELTDHQGWAAGEPTVREAQTKARAVGVAAGAAAWEAAWAAAGAAAWAAAGAAAWEAACVAAGAAAGEAAGAAVWAAVGVAAGAAAWEALQPTVTSLQASAFDLLDRMCAVGTEVDA